MNIHTNLQDLPSFERTIVTIGSFDGVHSGHQKILRRVNQLAKGMDCESVVITFHPHPREIIYPKDQTIQLLTSLSEKLSRFEQLGVNHVVVVPFTIEFSQMHPREYVENFLMKKFKPACIVIGYDHRFGLNREGSVNLLRDYEKDGHFKVIEIARHEEENITISSTKIRNYISEANIKAANSLLAHSYMLTGKVVDGEKLGSRIGFPTANLEISEKKKIIPPDGIYAVHVALAEKRYQGMLYIGLRPTVNKGLKRSIEVNIFDFNEQIYGEEIRIEIDGFIREDQRFDSLKELTKQLEKDRLKVLSFFNDQTKLKKISPELAVVILNYNGLTHLKKYLSTYIQMDYANYTIYLADNGSTDASLQYVKEHYPQIRILKLLENHGYAGGYNLALEQIEAKYFAIVNSDLSLTPNWAGPIIDAMEKNEKIAVCQPKIRSILNPEYFEYAGASGGYIDLLAYPFCRGRMLHNLEKDEGQYEDPQSIFWATGAACIVRSSAFREVGGFDADYFAHQEEIDLCWRMQRAGYSIKVIPSSIVFHLGGGTLSYDSPQKIYLNFRNNLATIIKNQSRLPLIIVLCIRLILDGLAGINFLVKGQFSNCLAIVQAHLTLYSWVPTLLKKRKDFKKRLARFGKKPVGKVKGVYRGYMLIDYYLLGRKVFSDLPIKKESHEL